MVHFLLQNSPSTQVDIWFLNLRQIMQFASKEGTLFFIVIHEFDHLNQKEANVFKAFIHNIGTLLFIVWFVLVVWYFWNIPTA